MGVVDAEFENGVLRPMKPLDLRPGERVRIIIVRPSDPARWDLERLAGFGDEDRKLAESGLGHWAEELDKEDRR